MAAPADEETDRWLWWASERGNESDGLEFKDQRVLGESPYFVFEGQVKYNHPGEYRRLEIVGFSTPRELNNETLLILEAYVEKVEIPNQHTSRFVGVSWSRSERFGENVSGQLSPLAY